MVIATIWGKYTAYVTFLVIAEHSLLIWKAGVNFCWPGWCSQGWSSLLWRQPEKPRWHQRLPGDLGSGFHSSHREGMLFSGRKRTLLVSFTLSPICKQQPAVVLVQAKCLLSDGHRLVLLSLSTWNIYVFWIYSFLRLSFCRSQSTIFPNRCQNSEKEIQLSGQDPFQETTELSIISAKLVCLLCMYICIFSLQML